MRRITLSIIILHFILLLFLFLSGCGHIDPAKKPVIGPAIKKETLSQIDQAMLKSAKPVTPGSLRINEVSASNYSTLKDQFNNSPDWIELYNLTDKPLNLTGCYLSDDNDNLRKWQFDVSIIKPNDYFLVFASGNDIKIAEDEQEYEIGITPYAYGWADERNNPPGKSYIKPERFNGTILGEEKGKLVISALMYLDDNKGTDLPWNDTNIKMSFTASNSPIDFTGYNYISVIGTLEKGKELQIFVCQKGVKDWLSFNYIVKGTGVVNDEYVVPIIDKPELDISAITGIRFDALAINKITKVHITDVIFKKRQAFFHTNFKVSRGGETLILSDPEGNIIDQITTLPVSVDISQGLLAHAESAGAENDWGLFKKPTPGRANLQQAFKKITSPVTFNIPGGFYNSTVTVKLSHQDSAEIFYTTDGSYPDTDSNLYTDPIIIKSTTVMRVIAQKELEIISSAITNTYFIGENIRIPVVSLAAEPFELFDPVTGMYQKGPNALEDIPNFGANFWEEREMPVHVEFFETDKSLAFSLDAGLQIFGNWSRSNPKKSLALFFRNRYGQGEIDYTLFPEYPDVRKFRSIIFRNNGGNYQKAMIEDALQCSLISDRNIDFQKYRATVVFINGKYWGIHNLREKLNWHYLYSNYGLVKEEVELIKGYGEVQAGSRKGYNDLMRYVETKDLSKDIHYEYICSQVDIDNYMTYYLSNIFYANTDWPANNNKWWRSSRLDNKWRWILYDTDFGFGSWEHTYDKNMIEFATETEGPDWPNPPWSTIMLRKLLKNKTFKNRFIIRACALLNTNFRPDVVINKIDKMARVIEPEIPRDFKRWNTDQSIWKESIQKQKEWPQFRPDAMRENFKNYFKLEETVTLTLDTNKGDILLDNLSLGAFPHKGLYFTGVPITISAGSGDATFEKWSDGNTEATRTVILKEDIELKAIFK